MPREPHGRAQVRLWTRQLDEGIHDAGIAVLSFAIAFRHQYIERGDAGQRCSSKSRSRSSASAGAT